MKKVNIQHRQRLRPVKRQTQKKLMKQIPWRWTQHGFLKRLSYHFTEDLDMKFLFSYLGTDFWINYETKLKCEIQILEAADS